MPDVMTARLDRREEDRRPWENEIEVRFPTRSLKEDGTFSGYGSVFHIVDSYGTRVAPGAFSESIKRKPVRMLRGHDPDRVIGRYTTVREDKHGLYLEGAFNLDVQDARETYSLVKNGDLDGLSIGFVTEEFEEDRKSQVRTLTKVDLWEVSVVTFAANAKASVVDIRTEKDADFEAQLADVQQIRAADWVRTKRDFERFLRDAGGFSIAQAKKYARAFEADTNLRDEDGSLSELLASVRGIEQALKTR